MNTKYFFPNRLPIPFIFWLSVWVHNFGHAYTHKRTLFLIKKCSYPKLLRHRHKWLCIIEWEINTDSFYPNGLPNPLFKLSNYYEGVGGHKPTKKHPSTYRNIKFIKKCFNPDKKCFFVLEWEMTTETFWPNWFLIPLFSWATIIRSYFWSYTHTKVPYH